MAPSWSRLARCRTAGVCLAFGSIWLSVTPAGAVDWQVLYRLSETLRVSDNIQLRPQPEGLGFSSRTSAGLDIAALTQTSEWRTTGDIGHLIYFGDDIPLDRERTNGFATSSFLHRTLRTDFDMNAFFRIAPASGSVFADPLLTDPLIDPELELLDFDRIGYGGSGGFIHRLTRADSLALHVAGERVDFIQDAVSATPHTSFDISGIWTSLLTPRLDGRVRGSLGYFGSDDDKDIRRLIHDLTVGANLRATRLLIVDANAGVSIIDQRQTDVTVGNGLSESDLSVGFIGDVSLIYTPRRDTVLTFSASQNVSPDSLGNLRTRQSVRGLAAYQINALSSLNLAAAYTTSAATEAGGEARKQWTLSPTYSHALTRNWSLALSYQWVKSDVAESNSAFLTLSHHGFLLP